jgi:hypothetical protein
MIIEETASNYIPNEEPSEYNTGENNTNGYSNEGNEQKSESWIMRMLKSETGEGTIQSYSNHPLNTKNNDYVGQILRGLTGMMGSLNFAILDIILGCFGLSKERNDITNYTVSSENTTNNDNKNYGEPTVRNGERVV